MSRHLGRSASFNSSVNYISRNDAEYIERLREIISALPLGTRFTEPVELLPHVYLGSQLHAESLKLLRKHGITHVLNCAGYCGPREHPERSPYEGLGIDYLEFKAHDNDEYDITQHFNEVIKYLDRVSGKGGKVLVHCAMGINRSVACAAAYIMWHKNWPLLKTIQYIKDRRRLCLSNEGFRQQLVHYARAKGFLDKLPPRKKPREEEEEDYSYRTRSREAPEKHDRYKNFYEDSYGKGYSMRSQNSSLPRSFGVTTLLDKEHFKRSDSLLDTGLMFRIQRFMNRDKV